MSIVRKVVQEAYDTTARSGVTFSKDDIIEAAATDSALDSVAIDEILHEVIRSEVDRIDRRRGDEGEDETPRLFGDEDQVIRLGDGARRRRGSLTRDQVLVHMGLVSENVSKVNAAAAREGARVAKLLPHFTTPSTTWAQAIDAYCTSSPSETGAGEVESTT